ncbi:O-antigen ligase family protein [Rhodoferax saidenbachensis]|uniref:O-antigen ligase n=1 Tax=Rhodoferax saidenbachensis TaxID=1484693 RepID=A0ABU1ZJA0_9BURK|nr:O-antigen ligase family protein [Rhodoferax saidenbachensis]MDR7305630.1 O-antigen ligase [Rhodoferax saidenbachensis]
MEYLFPAVLLFVAFAAAIAISLAGVGALNFTGKYKSGLLPYYCYALLMGNGVAVLLSTRNYLDTGELFSESTLSNPVAALAIKVASLFVMIAAVDQFVRFFKSNKKFYFSRVFLFLSFAAFWVCNIILPAYFSPHRASMELSWTYSLVLGCGLILISGVDGYKFIEHFRNATLSFCFVSLVLIFIKPSLVLQTNYAQGYIPGLPRFAGLAPHAILMGMIASLALWCLFLQPFQSRKLTIAFSMIGMIALFLSQAKNIWISFFISMPILMYYRSDFSEWFKINHSKGRFLYFVVLILGFFLGLGGLYLVVFGNLDRFLAGILRSEQGSQLLTFTGREQIWAVALSEWERSPLLGYGLPLFGPDHRNAVGMFFATSGHNQIIDNLGRSGLIGAIASVVHFLAVTILGYLFRHKTQGLSWVLALSLLVRMISEVPITLASISLDTLPYYLLLGMIAANMKLSDPKPSFLKMES